MKQGSSDQVGRLVGAAGREWEGSQCSYHLPGGNNRLCIGRDSGITGIRLEYNT